MQTKTPESEPLWYEKNYTESPENLIIEEDYRALRPADIFHLLTERVADQDEACRKVATMMYQHLHGHRTVSTLVGPTGSGKSFITEQLQRLFPDIVYLRDVSNLSKDGWSGSKKLPNMFQTVRNPARYNGVIFPLIVFDECDKLFAPQTSSGGENVSDSLQSELLSVVHGTVMELKEGEMIRRIDTRPMSFLFAGSFEKKAAAIAEDASGARLGFGASFDLLATYERELTFADIEEAGCIPELAGRMERIINLHPFDESLYRSLLDDTSKGPLAELEKEFSLTLHLSAHKKDALAQNAFSSGHGMRGIKRELRRLIDDAMWEDCDVKEIEIV